MANKAKLSNNHLLQTMILNRPWSMKIFYLGFFSGMGVYLPYLGLYLGAVGLTGTQIGITASLFPLAGMLMPPLWGMLSDHYGWRKQLLTVTLLSAVLVSLVIWQISHAFLALLLSIALLAIALSPAIPLADAITLQWIGEQGGNYGSIRVYGSVGFLIAAITAGSIMNIVGINALFLILAIVFCIPLLASFFVPGQSKAGMARIKGGEVLALLKDHKLMLFMLFCMIGYGTYAGYNTFFGLYLHSLGVSTAEIGLASGLATLIEMPTMMLSGVLMKRLGLKWLLLIGLGVAIVRWLAYATFTTYPLLFLFTLLHGVSFACFYIAAVTFIDRRVPIHLRTTGQTLFYGTSFGLATWIGNNIFGALYERWGGQSMYLIAAGICVLALPGLLFVMSEKRENPQAEEQCLKA